MAVPSSTIRRKNAIPVYWASARSPSAVRRPWVLTDASVRSSLPHHEQQGWPVLHLLIRTTGLRGGFSPYERHPRWAPCGAFASLCSAMATSSPRLRGRTERRHDNFSHAKPRNLHGSGCVRCKKRFALLPQPQCSRARRLFHHSCVQKVRAVHLVAS